MNRTIISTAQGLRSFDFISFEHDVLTALAQLTSDLLGSTATVVTGFAAAPTAPASLTLNLGAGAIYQLADADATADGAIPQDLTQIMQQGTAAAQQVTLAAPTTSGQSQWNLIQAQFSQVDQVRSGDPNGGNPPFYNAANPSNPTYNSVNTERAATVVLQVVKGAAATTGSEVPPNPTAGWVPLYLVDLAFGQTQITAGQILTAGPSVGTNVPSNYTQAPFLVGLNLPGSRLIDIRYFEVAGTYTYTPTRGTQAVIVEVQAGGGAGGGCPATGASQQAFAGGASSGGYGRKRITSGFSGATVTVGAGGAAVSGAAGGNGGSSSFGALVSATGGQGGQVATIFANTIVTNFGGTTTVGTATGGDINLNGGYGKYAAINTQTSVSGEGAASFFGAGAPPTSGSAAGTAAVNPGSGGSGGGIGASQSAVAGGNGAPGIVVVWEFA